jgi:hypothetical protein
LLLAGRGAYAEEYRILAEQSVFAVVTHKGGFASGMAHNHFIAASNYAVRLDFDETDPLATKLEVRFAAEDLVVDSPEQRQRWYPRLEALGILDKSFGELSDKDRENIRKTMLSEKQLDATAFPEISARIVSVAMEGAELGGVELSHRVTLALSTHGQSVEKPLMARYELVDRTLRIEAVGVFRFRDFGIKPYSAMLGAVKNKDEFHIYVSLVAVPESG